MSELIANRKHRQEILKGIIRDIHAGADVEEVKSRFADLLAQVGPAEIGEIEQALINEGMPVEEIQRLCDVHVAVFRDSLEKQLTGAAAPQDPAEEALHDLKEFNKKTGALVEEIRGILDQISSAPDGGADHSAQLAAWAAKHQQLLEVDKHYAKKENVLFPYLERYGISGPPMVMWGKHDEIRAALKEVTQVIAKAQEKLSGAQLAADIGNIVLPALADVSEMIYKEENILFPLCRETFTQDEWREIGAQFKDPLATVYKSKEAEARTATGGAIELEVGALTPEQLNLIFSHLPVDLTFVDENDEVAFFSLGPERIFERTRAAIGRKVQLCHPPSSMGVVERILDDFKSGRRDVAEFWIPMKDMLVHIRYFAVRDSQGRYRGTLEVTQNIAEIKKITGEKRIYDYES